MRNKKGPTKVLVVEDSSTQAEKLKYLLEKNSYSVLTANCGKEALELLTKQKPAIIISDIIMPGMDGYELCRHIKHDENLKHIPVILLTALSDIADILKGLECNADNFVTKPYDESFLLSKIDHILLSNESNPSEKVQSGIEVAVSGKKFLITSQRRQIIDLLLSTHEIALQQKNQLLAVQEQLKASNEQLQQRIEERTAALNEAKRAGEAMRESESKYRNLFENMTEEVHFWQLVRDGEGRIKTWRLIDANPPTLRTWDKTREQVLGKTTDEIFGPGATEHYMPVVQKIFAEGKPYFYEDYFPNLDKYFRFTSVPFGEHYITTGADISDIKKVELALRESEQRLKYHAQNSPLAVVEWDADYVVIQWSKEAERMFGWTGEETLGKRIDTLNMIHEEDIPIVNKTMERLSSGKEPIVVSSNRNHTKSGAVIECIWYNSVLVDDKGKMASTMSLVQDITERKKMEDALQRNVEQLGAANKELESFSYSLSHDLKSPLRAMMGFGKILLDDQFDKLDSTGRDFLQRIIGSADKMNGLIDDMLSLAKISRQEMTNQEIDLGEMARSIVGALQQNEPARIVDVVIAPDAKANGDARLMNIALSNLLGNAWKYSSKTPKPKIEFGIMEKNCERAYFVRDNGVGFDMKQSKRLFTPFQRLHSESQFAGTGIGLAIVKRVIQRHGGKVWAESEINEGATFCFTMPLTTGNNGEG